MARVGQFFTIASVVIGSLLIGVVVTTSSSFIEESETATKSYFDSAVRSAPRAVDDALARNNSVHSIKRRLYAHHRMIELSAQRRSIDYRAKHLVVLPPQSRALYINYAPEVSTLKLNVNDSSTETNVQPMQSETISYGDGEDFNASISEEQATQVFNATQPRSLAFMQMSTDSNLLRRTAFN